MVMLAFVKKQPLWLAAAVLWHAVVDGIVVFSVAVWGAYVAEFLIAFMATAGLIFVLRMRKPEPEIAAPIPLGQPEPTGILRIDVTADKLDDSKYFS
jgi:hypothetical protein